MPKFYGPEKDIHDYFLEGLRRDLLLKPQPVIINLDGKEAKSFVDKFAPKLTPKITKVVANEKNGYTIVKFSNNYVAKVKCNNEDFDLEKAVAMAVTKYLVGNNNFYKALENATVIKKEEK